MILLNVTKRGTLAFYNNNHVLYRFSFYASLTCYFLGMDQEIEIVM